MGKCSVKDLFRDIPQISCLRWKTLVNPYPFKNIECTNYCRMRNYLNWRIVWWVQGKYWWASPRLACFCCGHWNTHQTMRQFKCFLIRRKLLYAMFWNGYGFTAVFHLKQLIYAIFLNRSFTNYFPTSVLWFRYVDHIFFFAISPEQVWRLFCSSK